MDKNMINRPGPPLKIDEKAEASILHCLAFGGSLRDAAEYVGITCRTLYNRRMADPDFARRVKQAEIKGKIRHLKKIGKAPQWQASAFMLERKWWKEYGRRPTLKPEVMVTVRPMAPANLSGATIQELEQLREITAKIQARGTRLLPEAR